MPDKSNIIRISSSDPDPEIIDQAGWILSQKKGIVIFPAKCLYGVAVNALDSNAIQKVFDLKQRPPDKPLLVLVKNRKMIEALVTDIPTDAVKLMDAVWPGNLTLIFNAQEYLPKTLTAGTGKIGIRIPSHPVAHELVKQVNFPITGTSANISGEKGVWKINQLPESFLNTADLILESDPLQGGKGSTIADITQTPVQVLREGEILESQIRTILNYRNN